MAKNEVEALKAQLEAAKAENERLRQLKADAAANRKLSCKVSEKGALSVYGLMRFPVTLYKEGWATLLKAENVAMIQKFAKDNDKDLKAKDDK